MRKCDYDVMTSVRHLVSQTERDCFAGLLGTKMMRVMRGDVRRWYVRNDFVLVGCASSATRVFGYFLVQPMQVLMLPAM